MNVEWDAAKAESNRIKHGVTFEEAASVFEDGLAVHLGDPDHSDSEARFIVLGYSSLGRLLFVSYTERDEVVRIISGRRANRMETRDYEENQ